MDSKDYRAKPPRFSTEEKYEKQAQLVEQLREHRQEIAALWAKMNDAWHYEDMVYRYHHQSFKVFYAQESTEEMWELFLKLAPAQCELDSYTEELVAQGTNLTFTLADNKTWFEPQSKPRRIMEAFLHCRSFLDLLHRYSSLEAAPTMLPPGWAAVLYLYNLR